MSVADRIARIGNREKRESYTAGAADQSSHICIALRWQSQQGFDRLTQWIDTISFC